MTYKILLHDTVSNNIHLIQEYKATSLKALKVKLKALQSGYCENETPTTGTQDITSNKEGFIIAYAESDCDFRHIAII